MVLFMKTQDCNGFVLGVSSILLSRGEGEGGRCSHLAIIAERNKAGSHNNLSLPFYHEMSEIGYKSKVRYITIIEI